MTHRLVTGRGFVDTNLTRRKDNSPEGNLLKLRTQSHKEAKVLTKANRRVSRTLFLYRVPLLFHSIAADLTLVLS